MNTPSNYMSERAPFPDTGGFLSLISPLFWRCDGTGFHLGFQVTERHCNPMGICHGGMLASLMDLQLPLGARESDARLLDHILPTISLQIDFLEGTPLGSWVEGTTQVLKITRRMVFAQGLLTANGTPTARGSSVMKIGPDARGSAADLGALLGRRGLMS